MERYETAVVQPRYTVDGTERYVEQPSRLRRFSKKYFKKRSALFFLVVLGTAILFFSLIFIVCAFVVNYSDEFETSPYGGLEAQVRSEFHYGQYWAGIPFIVTGVLVICSGCFQRNRELTFTGAVFCVISIGLSFFVISIDGPNWRNWDAMNKFRRYWEDISGVDCKTVSSVCTCEMTTISGNTTVTTTVGSLLYGCSEVTSLSALYGAIVGSAIVVAIISVFCLLTITKTLSWKRILGHRRRVYQDYDDVVIQNHRRSRPPSFVDLPYAKRAEFVEAPVAMPARHFNQTRAQPF